VKPLARVPAVNSFLAKRVRGPDLLSDYHYSIEHSFAILALQAKMEKFELKSYCKHIRKEINTSTENFTKLYSDLFSPFEVKLDTYNNRYYRQVDERNRELENTLNKLIENHRASRTFSQTITQHAYNHISLSRHNLLLALEQGAELVAAFYPEKIFKYFTEEEIVQFWIQRELAANDWKGLTKWLYSTIFGPSFLVPRESLSKDFCLQVIHLNTGKYVKNLFKGQTRDDLDHVQEKIFFPPLPVSPTCLSVRVVGGGGGGTNQVMKRCITWTTE